VSLEISDARLSEFHGLIRAGIPDTLPPRPTEDPTVSRAPRRPLTLDDRQKRLAVQNALRYFPQPLHADLAPEFAAELAQWGHIYMHRFRPAYDMRARPLDQYPAECRQAAAIMLMIQNNLDPAVAQHPYELVTYGGNGAVFQNWAQYLLTMQYLSSMTDEQTLPVYSGHPLGLFPSHPDAPRVVVTNGMVVPSHSRVEDYTTMYALGVSNYGQMTAGSYMYIGPQGIVHGTTIAILGAGRRYLDLPPDTQSLAGRIYLSSGLGGMSGAQGKAAVIAGCVGLIAEINPAAVAKRLAQGWIDEVFTALPELITRVRGARAAGEAVAIAYQGNVVDLWEALADSDLTVDLASDQTSLHIPFTGGYYPAGLTVEESNAMMAADPDAFRERVQTSLRRQLAAIDRCGARGTRFWDYGNAFLLECDRAGCAIARGDGGFRYPSYVEDVMGPVCFDYGFGPFRWVCTSGDPADLAMSDRIAEEVIEIMAAKAPPQTSQQYLDNLRWIRQAGLNNLVVGSQARILYSDAEGRRAIAAAFNRAIMRGQISAPIVIGRDHHDVSGTDSPYRETANIRDGSMFCADMAVQNFLGDGCRGATWVSLHNGGGVGWGEVINGGFGLVLDGSADCDRRLHQMLHWDVNNGVARRAWARNEGAEFTIRRAMDTEPGLTVTMPMHADEGLVDQAVSKAFPAD
jgi:urocanate hydratase